VTFWQWLEAVLQAIFGRPAPLPPASVTLTLTGVRDQTGPVVRTPRYTGPAKGNRIMASQLKDNQQGTLTPVFKDKKGNPVTPPAGSLAWSVDNADLLALTPSADSMTCGVAALGPLGTANVTLNTSDNSITGHAQIEVIASAPTTIEIDLTGVTDQP
jgi:hypothetical protein